MATSEADIAAQLIERLLGDPQFRDGVPPRPGERCRKAGLDELADEMSMGAGQGDDDARPARVEVEPGRG